MSIDTLEELDESFDDSAAAVDVSPRKRRGRLVAFLVALAMIGGYVAYSSSGTAKPSSARAINAQQFQDQFGAKVDLVALAALGGMVEVRITVLDVKKADALFHDPAKMPRLMVEKTGQILDPPAGMKHSMKMVFGGSYFILYGNGGGGVTNDAQVSVVVGDVRLAHYIVKS